MNMNVYSQFHLGWYFRVLFQSSKLERLFSLKRGKKDVRALSFELSKLSPQVGLSVQRQTNIVCLPASLCISLQHLTRRLDTIAMLISSHLNQQFWTDSTQLAGGIVLQAAHTCCDVLQEAVPCAVSRARLLSCCWIRLSPKTCATYETCREVSCHVLFLENGPVTSNEKSHLVVSSSEELYQCGQTDQWIEDAPASQYFANKCLTQQLFPLGKCNQVVARGYYSAVQRNQHVHGLRFRTSLLFVERRMFVTKPVRDKVTCDRC